jgi:hypothetical protein
MTIPIEAARRIVGPRKTYHVNTEDAVAVARFVVALVDAKDDLADIEQTIADGVRCGVDDGYGCTAWGPRLIARIRAAEPMNDHHRR